MNNNDTVKFTVNLPRDLHKRAKIMATQTDTTLAKVIRQCLEDFVGMGEVKKKENNEKSKK